MMSPDRRGRPGYRGTRRGPRVLIGTPGPCMSSCHNHFVHRDRFLDLGRGRVGAVAVLVGVDDAAARRGVGHRRAVGAGHAAHPGIAGGSTENFTGLPDPPPVADKVSDPPTKPEAGGRKKIACIVRTLIVFLTSRPAP